MTGIVLADDHTIFAESLAAVLINAGFSVLAVTRSLLSTRHAIRQYRPEICLLDRYFPDGDGLTSMSDISAICPQVRIIMLTASDDTGMMVQAIGTGAAGYVHKTWGLDALLAAIGRVARGDVVIEGPRQTPQRADRNDARRLAAYLTARERECLALLVEGLDTGAITRRLGVSTTTVRSHVQALLTKLGVHSRLEAASFAVRHDLVEHRTATAPLTERHGKAG